MKDHLTGFFVDHIGRPNQRFLARALEGALNAAKIEGPQRSEIIDTFGSALKENNGVKPRGFLNYFNQAAEE